ncbi:MAG TPA: type II toxin-antitoxin system PemK/MazF family toxin [Nannocystis exedens]|nr:type II toxin-antitoxin system PemK/MazF family toxin [Nannocystis exedens]
MHPPHFEQTVTSTAKTRALVVAITSNLRLAEAPGNVRLTRRQSKLPRASVVNVSRVLTLGKQFLTERVGRLSPNLLTDVDQGLRLVLSL